MNQPLVGTASDTVKRNTAAMANALVKVTGSALPVTPHEGYAKILERLDDLKTEVFHGSRTRARQDALRLAAAAMRLLLIVDRAYYPNSKARLEIVEVREAVRRELERAQSRFGPYVSPHEGYAVILEECDELWEEIKSGADGQDVWTEAVQVAAMGLRFHVDIADGLTEELGTDGVTSREA